MKSQDDAKASTTAPFISVKFTILLILFAFLIFSNTVNQYFLLDDFEHLYSIRYNSLSETLIGQDTNLENRFFRPIPMFFFWVQSQLFGPSPAVFHLTSIFLHVLCALLGAHLLYILSKNARCSMIFGFVFVAFPNHAEIVNWPAANFTLWTTAFYLGSLVLFGFSRLTSRLSFLLLSLVSFSAAMLSSEAAFTLPIALIAFDFVLSKSRRVSAPLSRRVFEYSPYFGVLPLALVLRSRFLWAGIGYPTVEGESIISFYLNNIFVFASDIIEISFHAWKYLIAPISPEIPYANQIMLAIWLLLILALALLIWKKRLDPATLIYCLFFACVAISPMIGTYRFFDVTHWTRYIYMASIGSSCVVAMVIDGILTGIDRPAMRRAVLVGAVFPLVALTKYYDAEWIRAQEENKEVVQATVDYLAQSPSYSRVYVSGTPLAVKDVPRIDGMFSSAVGIYLDRRYRKAYTDFHPGDRPLALDREVHDERQWRYTWLNWNDETRGLDVERSIQPPKATGTRSRALNLDNRAISQGLEAANDMARVHVPDFPYPVYEIGGGWALLKMPPFKADAPIKYLTIEMMLRREDSKRDVSRLLWVTRQDLNYTGKKSISFFAKTDGRFHEYTIPLYKNGLSLIDPEIVRFAIRPSQKPGAVFSIRKIIMEYY